MSSEPGHHSTNPPVDKHASLRGVRILIARPQEQGAALAETLKQQGAEVIQLPTIEIQPTPDSQSLKNCFLNLDQYSHIIAISAHAAHFGLQWVDQYWPQLPIDINWYAVGKRTASVFEQEYIQAITPKEGHDSESLLNLPELAALNNQSILILRGAGGRELLKQQLEQRGAKVDYAELYQRVCPDYTVSEIDDALITFSPDILIALSGETLHNLIKISQNKGIALKNRITMTDKAVLVPSKRVAEQAQSLGFNKIWIPQALDEQALVECIASNCIV